MSEVSLIMVLEELEESAQGLQNSLLDRNPEEIWSAMARQEATVEKLSQLQMQSPHEMKFLTESNTKVRSLLGRSQSVLRTNRALTRTFLNVIDETLSRLSGSATKNSIYSAGGRSMRRPTPCLVSQQG